MAEQNVESFDNSSFFRSSTTLDSDKFNFDSEDEGNNKQSDFIVLNSIKGVVEPLEDSRKQSEDKINDEAIAFASPATLEDHNHANNFGDVGVESSLLKSKSEVNCENQI
eukprot:Awhi_evm1s439